MSKCPKCGQEMSSVVSCGRCGAKIRIAYGIDDIITYAILFFLIGGFMTFAGLICAGVLP